MKGSGYEQGLGEIHDVDYTLYRHDMAVTDLRILFHGWGNTEWVCERILSKRNDLRHLPDAMVYHQGHYLAIEYESSRKSKKRYHDIFIECELDNHMYAVIYVVDSKELVERIREFATPCKKILFTTFQELQDQKLDTLLKGVDGTFALRELFGGKVVFGGFRR